jgi:hypothetical protein
VQQTPVKSTIVTSITPADTQIGEDGGVPEIGPLLYLFCNSFEGVFPWL